MSASTRLLEAALYSMSRPCSTVLVLQHAPARAVAHLDRHTNPASSVLFMSSSHRVTLGRRSKPRPLHEHVDG